MNDNAIEILLRQCSFPGFDYVLVRRDDLTIYLQIQCHGTDNNTGKPLRWSARKWLLSPHMTKDEIVQTALLATLTAVEHETREKFLFQGQAIFGPHLKVDRLLTLASDVSAREVA